jgi:hypothetical protein
MGEPTGKEKSWLDKVEDYASSQADEGRKLMPGPLKPGYDAQVGIRQGLYDFAKGLGTMVVDVLTWSLKLDKLEHDRKTQEATWNSLVIATRKVLLPTKMEEQQLVFGVWDSITEAWAEAGKTEGKQTRLAFRWTSRTVLEIGSLFWGPGEVEAGADALRLAKAADTLNAERLVLANVATKCPKVATAEEALAAEKALAAAAKAVEPADAAKAGKAVGAVDAAKAAKAAEAADAAKVARTAKDAEKVGMNPDHVKALVEDCAKKDRLVVYRKSNPESLKFHGKKGYRAKPHEVEVLKTAKEGENAGLVVRPMVSTEKEMAEITKLENEGWTFDEEGRLLDPDKNMIHGDYDMQGVYKEVGTDAQGKPIHEKVDTNSESSYFLEDQNEMITPERDMHQHGANDNYTKTGPNGEKVMGRTPGADETYLVVDKNGTQVIESTAELQKVYEANNIPWPY